MRSNLISVLTSILISFLVISGSFQAGIAQIRVSGTIYDDLSQEPLAGARVLVKGTPKGVFANLEGWFELNGLQTGDTLVVSFIEMESKEIVLGPEPEQTFTVLLTYTMSPPVAIYSFSHLQIWQNTPASLAYLNSPQIDRGSAASLAPALNQLPGVQMDERGFGGSRRISIRASLLRSPFGVRNLKTYWNGMPISSPDGSSPAEILDIALMDSIGVLKGPNSSLYGAGTGGVINIKSDRHHKGDYNYKLSGEYGSWGYLRHHFLVGFSDFDKSIRIGVMTQQLQGYRDQEGNRKLMFWFNSQNKYNKGHEINLMGWFYNGKWELPGALSPALRDDNPRQALPFSIENNASVSRKRTRIGINWKTRFSSNLSQSTSGYVNYTKKLNPFGTSNFFQGYKDEEAFGFGGRTEWNWKKDWNIITTEIKWGAEGQMESNDFQEYDNNLGQPGDLRFSGFIGSVRSLAFAEAKIGLPMGLELLGGISLNGLQYRLDDHFFLDSLDNSLELQFSPILAPRIALRKDIGEKISLHAQISRGFSNPTLWELQNEDALLNTGLTPEEGINYELGMKGLFLEKRMQFSADLYYFKLENAILPYFTQSGFTQFQNSGEVDQYGLEILLKYNHSITNWGYKSEERNSFFDRIRPWLSLNFTPSFFGEYLKNGEDFTGQEVPGIPIFKLASGIDLRFMTNYYFRISTRYVSSVALDDGNTEFGDAYTLLNAKAGWEHDWNSRWKLNIWLGGRNLLNQKYTSFYALNAFGDRYFNPAPSLSIFGGFEIAFNPKRN